jgi:hypothetical protein
LQKFSKGTGADTGDPRQLVAALRTVYDTEARSYDNTIQNSYYGVPGGVPPHLQYNYRPLEVPGAPAAGSGFTTERGSTVTFGQPQ